MMAGITWKLKRSCRRLVPASAFKPRRSRSRQLRRSHKSKTSTWSGNWYRLPLRTHAHSSSKSVCSSEIYRRLRAIIPAPQILQGMSLSLMTWRHWIWVASRMSNEPTLKTSKRASTMTLISREVYKCPWYNMIKQTILSSSPRT